LNEQDFPALYRSANKLSLESQASFLKALKAHLITLVLAAVLSILSTPHWSIAILQLLALLTALGCSIYLFSKRPDRYWYSGRAVAESVKTITWRFATRAEPFDTNDEIAQHNFREKLRSIVDQNREVAGLLTEHISEAQITDAMRALRSESTEHRRNAYAESRIGDQLSWYAKKASWNRKASANFFLLLIAINSLAVVCAALRIQFPSAPYWPTDVFVAAAASLLTWMQAKRFSELASSYALAAHEIGLIREKSRLPGDDKQLSQFVGDAENAFSREHTQWVARRDA
jgi:hypothetical protein